METIEKHLPELELQLMEDIKSSYYSIYKIKTKDENFIKLEKDLPTVKNAVYLVNPNFDDADGTMFLSGTGKTIYKANFFANNLLNDPLDFIFKAKNYSDNHPFSKSFDSFEF